MLRALFIDAGHGLGPTGGMDNGASGFGTTERKEVVEVALELFARMRSDAGFSGVEVVKVGVDERLTLRDHIARINAHCRSAGFASADALVVSIHMNAAGDPAARGVEAWYSPEEGTVDFARALVEQVAATTGMPARRKPVLTTAENRFGRLGIIDDTIPRGCLIECGFVTNEFDAALLKDSRFDDKVAEGIHRGIRAFLGMPALPSSPAPAPVPVAPAPIASDLRDVPANAWYAAAVWTCVEEGLFRRPTDGLFHPERPVTRAELAAVMARHLSRRHPNS